MKLFTSALAFVLVPGLLLGVGYSVNAQDGSTPHVEIPARDPSRGPAPKDGEQQGTHGGGVPPKSGATRQGGTPDDRIAKLEAAVAELVAQRDRDAATMQAIVTYLDARAKAAESLSKSLDTVEQAGFTAGINPRSREVLLGSWRSFLATEGRGLPKLAPAAVTPARPKVDAPARRPRTNGDGSY